MNDFFKPSDFIGQVSSGYVHIAAKIANDKLNKLIESWPVVILEKSNKHASHNKWVQDDGGFRKECFTHTARLAFIEEIKKEPCNHKPSMARVGNANWEILTTNERGDFMCAACGIEIEATWSEKK
jgi:hypothetical protein